MIHESPYNCTGKDCDTALSQTAEAAQILQGIVLKAIEDMADRLQIQADSLQYFKMKAEKYARYRLTLQQKKLTEITDILDTSLQNNLTEQAVLINLAAPGLADEIANSGGLVQKAPESEQAQWQQTATNGNVPLSPVPSGASLPGNTVQTQADSKPGTGGLSVYQEPSRTDYQNTLAASGQQPPPSLTLPPPVVHLNEGLESLTYQDGSQVTANVHLTVGELQIYNPVSGQLTVVPVLFPSDSLPVINQGGPLAIVVGGGEPQAIVVVPVTKGDSSNVTSTPGDGTDAYTSTLGTAGKERAADVTAEGMSTGHYQAGSGNAPSWTEGLSWCQPGSLARVPGYSGPSAGFPANPQLGIGEVCVMVRGVPCAPPAANAPLYNEVREPEGSALPEEPVSFDDPDDYDTYYAE